MVSTTPATVVTTNLTFRTLASGFKLHRIHQNRFGANQFNDSAAGNARFSPLFAGARVIPTIYAGENFDCAAMETVFHDVPFAAGPKRVAKIKFQTTAYSILECRQDFHLVDLRGPALRKLGVPRSKLIDTTAHHYPVTRRWAQTFHALDKTVHGVCWTSRQNDQKEAFVFFGDRINVSALAIIAAPILLLSDATLWGSVLDLASRIGVDIV